MEEYKKALNNILIPSLFIFLVCAASAVISFSMFTGKGLYSGDSLSLGPYRISSIMATGSIILLLSFLILPFIYRASMSHGKPALKLALLLIISVIISLSISGRIKKSAERSMSISDLDRSVFTIKGRIVSIKEHRYGNEAVLKFSILNRFSDPEIIQAESSGYLYLQEGRNLNVGDIIKTKCRIKNIDSGRMISSYNMNLLRQGVHFSIKPETGSLEIISIDGKRLKARISGKLSERIEKLFASNTSAMIKALYFGNRNHISKGTSESFRKAGVLHVLAASGLHVGIIASIPVMLLGLVRINRKVILSATIAVLAFYLFITGMPVSLLRASLMFALAAVIFLTGLEMNIFNMLFLAASLIIISAPEQIFNPGFQLSFGATGGILIFYRIFRKIFSFLPGFISSSIALTISAQVFVLPLAAYHMGNINFTGILANIVVIPAVSILLILSIVAGSASFLVMDAGKFLGEITDLVYEIILKFIHAVSRINGDFNAEVSFAFPLIVCSLAVLLVYPHIRKKILLSIPLFLCLLLQWYALSIIKEENRSRITVFERSGMKSILLCNNNSGVIIGSVPDIRTADKIINAAFNNDAKNIRFIITDPDFKNGVTYTYLLKKLNVIGCIISPDFQFSQPVKMLIRLTDKEGIKLKVRDIKMDMALLGPGDVNHDKNDFLSYANVINIYRNFAFDDKKNENSEFSGYRARLVNVN